MKIFVHNGAKLMLMLLATFAVASLTAVADDGEPKVYALLAIDSHADGIGHLVHIDRDNLTRVLFKAFDQDGRRHRLEWKILEGRDVSPENILKYYADLKSTKSDTLFFYYTGHGGTDQSQGHFLAMKYGRLYRSDLRGAMNYQDARLVMLITDCCANFPDKADVKRLPIDRSADWDTAKQLLFQARGFVDVNSASVGGLSFTNSLVGSYFTSAFCYEFCRPPSDYPDEEVTWSRFLAAVDKSVEKYASREKQLSAAFYVNRSWPKQQWERVLQVKNADKVPIKVFVEYRTKTNGGNWQWFNRPATRHWVIQPGVTTTLSDPPPANFVVRGDAIRIWAETLDGKWSWTKYKDRTLDLIDQRFGYSAEDREPYIHTFRGN